MTKTAGHDKRAGTIEYELPRVYMLALMNFCFDEHPDEHHHTVKLVNVEHGGVFV
jgi:hypothetical protein